MNMHRLLLITAFVSLLAGVALTQGRRGNPLPVQGYGSARRYINPPRSAGHAPFSDAVMVGDTLHMSGRLGVDPKTGQIPADPAQEIRFMMEGVRATLAQEGMTMDDLVTVQVFCTDLSLYDQFNGVYRTYFTRAVPARTFLGTSRLLRNARFEIQCTASMAQ